MSDYACFGGLCACVSVVCFTGSLLAQGLLLWEIDPNRDTCEELALETLAATGANLIVYLLGCLSFGSACLRGWGVWCGQGLAGLSALVVVLTARLTLFVHEAHLICAADLVSTSIPKNDLLVDEDTRGTLGAHAWVALLLFGVGVLLQQYSILCDCDDPCDPRSRVQPCDDPCADPCKDPCGDPCRDPCGERVPMMPKRNVRRVYVLRGDLRA